MGRRQRAGAVDAHVPAPFCPQRRVDALDLTAIGRDRDSDAGEGELEIAECDVGAVESPPRSGRAKARLESLSPLAVLNRGYALVFDEGGALIRDAASAPDGSLISTRFAQSTLRSQVIKS